MFLFWMDGKQPYEIESECESDNVYMGPLKDTQKEANEE